MWLQVEIGLGAPCCGHFDGIDPLLSRQTTLLKVNDTIGYGLCILIKRCCGKTEDSVDEFQPDDLGPLLYQVAMCAP